MKSKIIAAVCTILLFIPTYIAVFYYVSAQSAPVNVNVVSKMTIADMNGNVLEFERTTKKLDETLSNMNENMIEFFMLMNEESKEEIVLPDPLKGEETYNVTFLSYDKEYTYKYYFSNNSTEAFYTDNNGTTFKISEKYSNLFLLSEYARSLYPASKEPVFTLSGSTVIEPQKFNWEYLNYLNQYTVAKTIDDITTPIGTYNLMGGTLVFDFSVEPDYMYVTITENGNDIFTGTYDEIGTINLNEDAMIKVTVEAMWYDSPESPERGARGEAIYNFYGDVKAQPAFFLGKNIIEPGECVVLTGQNVENVSDIKFASEPSINFTPVFFEDEKNVQALIPIAFDLPDIIAMNTNDVIEYKLLITVYGKTHELVINVKAKEFRTLPYVISESIVTSKRTDKTIEEFDVAMTRIFASQESTRYWESGKFGMPIIGNESVLAGFGVTRNIKYSDNGATVTSYRNKGTDFVIGYGTPNVNSINKGKVIYVGEQILSGKTIVIDHGWGLKSTYMHLSAINVAEGDIVEKGDVIGVTGDTGFAKSTSLHVMLTVFDVPVSPYPLWWYDPDGIPMVDYK